MRLATRTQAPQTRALQINNRKETDREGIRVSELEGYREVSPGTGIVEKVWYSFGATENLAASAQDVINFRGKFVLSQSNDKI